MLDSSGITLRRLWVAGLVVSGIVGVYLLAASHGQSLVGLTLIGQAIAFLGFTERWGAPPVRWRPVLQWLDAFKSRILLGLAAGLILTAALMAAAVETQPNDGLYDLAV